tara:strand:+ start:5872 stop:7203 length:1332 start_codon:yes stop_codon:yes gene_type:complete
MSIQAELHHLLDLAVDNRLDAAGYARLDALILKDNFVCQSAVEFLDLDSKVYEWCQDIAAVDYIEGLLVQTQPPKMFRWRAIILAASVSSVALLLIAALIAGYFNWQPEASEPLGRIAALSEDVEWADRSYVSGDLIRLEDPLEITKGFVTIETNLGVMIDLSPKTQIQFRGDNKLYLFQGALSALVSPRGTGFTVETEDARIVDHGTEFIVEKKNSLGTFVAVNQGNIECFLLDSSGNSMRVIELSAGSAARFDWTSETGETIGAFAQMFKRFEQSQKIRSGLKSLKGEARYAIAPPADLTAGACRTQNYALLIAENIGVVLQEDISFQSLEGPRTLPAGSVISSYLLHYDPSDNVSRAGMGTIAFHQPVAAIIGDVAALRQTDTLFAIPKTRFSENAIRGVEISDDEDQIELDGSRHSLFFHFDMEPIGYLDQVRILVHHQ